MWTSKSRFDAAFAKAKKVPFNDHSKFILFSDCHRGSNNFADDFANNRHMYYHALKHYFNEGYAYVELGDGDELWEVANHDDIIKAHKNVYKLMNEFQKNGRLHMIYGNHDLAYQNAKTVQKNLWSYYSARHKSEVDLIPGLEMYESIRLQHDCGQEIFLVHGHQAEFMNSVGWRWNAFWVKYFWRRLQVFGFKDPTSPAQNFLERRKVERRIEKWVEGRGNQFTIYGHTHRPRFPDPEQGKQCACFNDGSCVHPRSITGIEIENSQITLIKWEMTTTNDGLMQVRRIPLEGPYPLSDYWN